MTSKTFYIGLFASFGLAWLCMIVIPVAYTNDISPVKMSDAEDAPYYQHGVSGRILNGSEIYESNGCYTCHTQLIRPTYAGQQIWRKESIAGKYQTDGDEIDQRRETNYLDYTGEKYAQVGIMRMGPDLSNFAYRAEEYAAKVKMTPEQWIFEHLYNPKNSQIRIGSQGEKLDMTWSICPAQKQMFETVDAVAQSGGLALSVKSDEGKVVRPQEAAKVLTSYLLSLKRDSELPASLSNAPAEE